MSRIKIGYESVALLWWNAKHNVNPGLSYFERYMVACAGFLANLHFTFCQSRQSKATLPWFWVTRFWIVPVLYRWILALLCFYGIWYYYIFLLNFFLLSFTASTFWANDAFSPTESRERIKTKRKWLKTPFFLGCRSSWNMQIDQFISQDEKSNMVIGPEN